MQSPLNTLLQKEMDRKDFLKHIAVGVVAITGVSTIVKAFSPHLMGEQSAFGGFGASQPMAGSYGNGYGTSAYGGSAVNGAPRS